jgi:AcrR family transcriptional regulator
LNVIVEHSQESSVRAVSPLYQRLPRGPHHMAPTEVTRNQRIRMHGAMVEAVAADGYEGTSVKQVIGLAGVSRRSFYEQFANKEECFLATFDLIVARMAKRVNKAYHAGGGERRDRLGAALRELAAEVTTHPKAAGLVIVAAQTAGEAGRSRVRRTTAALEQMISCSLARAPDASALPAPVVRAIVGGLQEAAALRLREGRAEELASLSDELLKWTLLFGTPGLEDLAARARANGARANASSNGHGPHANGTPPRGDGEEDDRGGRPREESLQACRARLLPTVLRLAVAEDYQELSAPQIAQEAEVPIEIFFELFADRDECFLAAFDMLSDELLHATADAELVSGDWPGAVRRVVTELLRQLAERPLYARTIAAAAFSAGPEAIARNLELAYGIATLLTEGAPGKARSGIALEGIAGAIWQLVRCQVAADQIQLLPALADHVAYVVLTPYLGAERAAAAVTEPLQEQPDTATRTLSVAGRRGARRSG